MVYLYLDIFYSQFNDTGSGSANKDDALIDEKDRVNSDGVSADELSHDNKLLEKTHKYVESDRAKKLAMETLENPKKFEEILNKAEAKFSWAESGPFAQFVENIKTLGRMLKAFKNGSYKEFPTRTILSALIAVIYFVNPLDFVPDFIIGLGQIDDAMVISYIFFSLSKDITKFKAWEEALQASETELNPDDEIENQAE